MRLLFPSTLLLYVLAALLAVFLVWRFRVQNKALSLIGDRAFVKNLYPRTIFDRRVWKSALWLVTLAALIFALVRPVWGIDLDIIETRGVSVMFVLDVSNSMNAEDVLPSRLERAKLSLQEMFRALDGNELGLILFAGTAFVQFPLTTDSASAETFLKAASSESISNQGTDMNAALQLALDSLNQASSRKKTIVLITDGENQQGNLDPVLTQAVQAGIAVDTIGYGDSEGAPIPVRDSTGQITGYKSDSAGNLVLSILDEATLRSIAERTSGVYEHATADGQEAQRLINLLNQGEGSTLNRDVQSHDVERFEIFVVLAVVAMMFEMFLPETKRIAA